MLVAERPLNEYLQKYFGFDKFKGDQEAIIKNVLAGKDTFVIMPTGGGKSMCYQLPPIIEAIGTVPIIALTATATPKVQLDIQKNLAMMDAIVFKASFNRANLYYEVRPKVDVIKEIIRFVKQNMGKSGIVYCLSRKKV